MKRQMTIFFTCLLFPCLLSSQVVLVADPSGLLECQEILTGETVTFQRSNFCGANVQIFFEGESASVFTEETFEYTFDLPGEYTIFCFAPPANETTQSKTAITAACYRVVDKVVPTLEQWGVINLSLFI